MPAETGVAAAFRKTIDPQISTARSGLLVDRNFVPALTTLATGAKELSLRGDEFRPRAAALAAAVCNHGNRLVPATLIKALFKSMRDDDITAQQLQITLHELTKARFADGMDATDIAHYLNIVGKAADHPDERLFVLRPLAAVLKDLSAQKKKAPGPVQLQVSLDAASEYFPSWRLEDTEALLDQEANLPPQELRVVRHTPEDLVRAYGSAASTIKTAIHSRSSDSGEKVKSALEELVPMCGDQHLSGFAAYLRDTIDTEDRSSLYRYSAVMDWVAELLIEERSNFELCIRPFIKHMAPKPRLVDLNDLHSRGMISLFFVAGKRDAAKGDAACLNSLKKVLGNPTQGQQAAYEKSIQAHAKLRAPARAPNEAELQAQGEHIDADVPYL